MQNDNWEEQLFDKGETFSGAPNKKGIQAVDKLKESFPNIPLPQLALKWILIFEAVSCVIPGASRPEQVLNNVEADQLGHVSQEGMDKIRKIYHEYIRESVHHLW